ncbi:tetratricopeptide repeat protein [Roseibium hamelinense]|uniref:Tetratricopeptide repeat protein n=1 Tax=Roseibium hamelinense TaxID=150831 RepID=A0A562TA67_9HYPH|nr:tetratricopeptide repeat protein [Roseibium hamelinense]MTI45129.1 tetratricopeptide repeat protein [Roseibium hamelinense]TWI90512.1 tetratricopeptide repeat protein [Roseibium hamelinense]
MKKAPGARARSTNIKSWLKTFALIGIVAGPAAHQAHAETSAVVTEPSSAQFGTPADLPVTLAGSYLAGRLAGFNKDYAQAAAFYQEALNTDQDNPMLLERTFILKLAHGDVIEAEHYANEMERVGNDNFLAHLTQASSAMLQGDYGDAEADLGKPGNAGPLAQLTIGISKAWALYGAGQVDAALQTIADLRGPEWFEVFKSTHRALIAFAAGQNELALSEIEAAYAADQGAIRTVDAYARLLTVNGRKADALEILDDFDRLLSGHPLLVKTRLDIESGAPIDPIVIDPAAGMAEILYGLGSAIGRDGAEELSAAYLQLSLHLDPSAEFAAIALGGLFERLEQPARAIDVLKMVPGDSPLKRDAEIQIGLNYNALDDIDSARAHLEALIAQDPNELEAITSLGNILRNHEKFEEAEKIYSQALATIDTINDEHWLLFYFRGICRERLGEWTDAEADFRKALELNKDQPLVLNYLGYSLVDQGLKLDEALAMIEKAVELRPNDGYIVDSLGWVYYKLGRYEEAVRELERAIELRPSDPVINDHLGDAYWKVGRRNEARFQWNHARDLEPEEDELPKIREKIANGLPDDPETNAAQATGDDQNGG